MKKLFAICLIFASIMGAAQTPALRNVLCYTETKGYNHNTKNQVMNMLNANAALGNYVVTQDDDGSEFTSLANLMTYDVVFFSNCSGNSGLDANQRANFEAYIAAGGSYLGNHAASDFYRHSTANGSKTGDWDWYAETVAGASVQESPNHTSSNHNNTMTHEVANHPTLSAIPSPWNKTEEYYYWENGYLATGFTELLRVGQTGSKSYDAPRMMAHCKNLAGGGRAFYTALGHSGSNYTSDQNFIQLIHDALMWVMDDQTTFGIEDYLFGEGPEIPQVQSSIEDGHIHILDEVKSLTYRVVTFRGRLVYEGTMEENKIPLIPSNVALIYYFWGGFEKVKYTP